MFFTENFLKVLPGKLASDQKIMKRNEKKNIENFLIKLQKQKLKFCNKKKYIYI